jgi:hypothetical protein
VLLKVQQQLQLSAWTTRTRRSTGEAAWNRMSQLLMDPTGRHPETGRDSALLLHWTQDLHTVCINNAGPGRPTEHMINELYILPYQRHTTYVSRVSTDAVLTPRVLVLQWWRDGTSDQQITSAP